MLDHNTSIRPTLVAIKLPRTFLVECRCGGTTVWHDCIMGEEWRPSHVMHAIPSPPEFPLVKDCCHPGACLFSLSFCLEENIFSIRTCSSNVICVPNIGWDRPIEEYVSGEGYTEKYTTCAKIVILYAWSLNQLNLSEYIILDNGFCLKLVVFTCFANSSADRLIQFNCQTQTNTCVVHCRWLRYDIPNQEFRPARILLLVLIHLTTKRQCKVTTREEL